MAPPASAYHAQQGRRRRRADGAPHLGRSVLRTASAALAAYGTYRLAAWAYNSWISESDDRLGGEEHSEDAGGDGGSVSRRSRGGEVAGERAERCRAETLRAVEDFLPPLRKAVEGRTDCAAEGRALKQIRRRRREREEKKPPPQDRGDGEQKHREKRDKDGGSHDRGQKDAGEGDGGNEADEEGVERDDDEEERRLWEVIKVRSITRLVSTAYAHAALLCLLTVQVHVMGRMLLEDEEGASGGRPRRGGGESPNALSSTSSAEEIMGQYHESHKLVLTRTFQHFFSDEGVGSLVQAVEEAVRNRLFAWNMTDPKLALCEEEFTAGLDAVRWSFESDRDVGNDAAWGEFLVHYPANAADDEEQQRQPDGGGEERARLVLDETWDAVESPLFATAMRECVEETFDVMRREYWGKTLFSPSTNGEKMSAANGETDGSRPRRGGRGGSRRATKLKLPLATIVTQLKHSSNSVYCTNCGGAGCGDSFAVGDRRPNGAAHSENMYVSASFTRGCPSLMELGDACFYAQCMQNDYNE